MAGDAPDPAGIDPHARGVSPGYNLTNSASGHPFILYRMGSQEIFLEGDVYAYPEQPMRVLINCPWCLARGRQVGLWIKADRKPFSYDPEGEVPPFPGWSRAQMKTAKPGGYGGRFTVDDTIACTWEEAPELQRGAGVGGFSACGWRVQIKDNVARDV